MRRSTSEIFIPDQNRDDMPDGLPETVLDGWTLDAKHNIVNGLTWGPDGWLYGCHGILADSKVGPPGMPEAERPALNCGVWRFHPTRKVFEIVAHGTTNPWSIAFNDYGQMFIANCVIKHLFHVAKHQPDLLKVNDPWFRGVALMCGSDGGAFMADWTDAGECHDYEDIHRENGRIYKITYGAPRVSSVDLAKLSDAGLVALQLHQNDWHASRARLLLQELLDLVAYLQSPSQVPLPAGR